MRNSSSSSQSWLCGASPAQPDRHCSSTVTLLPVLVSCLGKLYDSQGRDIHDVKSTTPFGWLMVHPDTEIRHIDDKIGYGVVAMRFIPRGTITWVADVL